MRCAACGTTCKCIQFVLRMQAHCARLCARLSCVSRQTNIRTRLPRTRWRLTSRVRPLCRTFQDNPTPWLAAALVSLESLDQGRENCGQHARTRNAHAHAQRTRATLVSHGHRPHEHRPHEHRPHEHRPHEHTRSQAQACRRAGALAQGAQAQGAQAQPHARSRLRARDELDAPARSRAPPGCVTLSKSVWKRFCSCCWPLKVIGFSSSESRFEHPTICSENQKYPHSKRLKSRVCDICKLFKTFRPWTPAGLVDL